MYGVRYALDRTEYPEMKTGQTVCHNCLTSLVISLFRRYIPILSFFSKPLLAELFYLLWNVPLIQITTLFFCLSYFSYSLVHALHVLYE